MNDTVLLLVNGWAGKNPALDAVMIFAAQYLIYIVFAVAAACIGYLLYRKEWKPAAYFFASLVVSFVLLKLAALLNFDHRPFMDHHLTQLTPHEPGKSFPSDHTTSSAAVALGILTFTRFKKIGYGLLAAACIIGFSRIFVGVHYPADILGGLVTASVGVGLVFAVRQIIGGRTSRAVAFDEK